MQAQDYESVKPVWKLLRRLLMPIVSIPCVGTFLFVKSSSLGRKIKRYAASHKALEIIYNYTRETTSDKGMFERFLTHILLNIINAKAVRNRLKLAKEEIKRALVCMDKRDIHVMSLASGSARAVIEVLVDVRGNGTKYTITLVDRSRNALNDSRKLAEENGIVDGVVYVRGMVEEFVTNGRDHPPDVVEMVGIMDYFDITTAQEVISQIYQLLLPGGVLITCNVADNPERSFLTNVLKWPMIYKDAKDIFLIMHNSGFDDVRVVYEPLNLHGVAIGRKATT